MTREEQFERMLAGVQTSYVETTAKMERLKAEGKQKTVAFRELLGQKLLYQQILDLYRIYGLID